MRETAKPVKEIYNISLKKCIIVKVSEARAMFDKKKLWSRLFFAKLYLIVKKNSFSRSKFIKP